MAHLPRSDIPALSPPVNRLEAVMAVTLLMLCLFPYVSPVRTPFDTQPYSVMFAVIVVFHFGLSDPTLKVWIPKGLVFFGLAALFALILLVSKVPTLDSVRAVVGYWSAFLIAVAAHHTFRLVSGRVLLAAVTVWFAVAAIQLGFERSFAASAVSRMSTTADRGITGLAVEPSFLAIVCIFFLIVNDLLRVSRQSSILVYWAVWAASVFQILLSRSALGLLILAAYVFVNLVARRRLHLALGLLVVVSLLGMFTELLSVARSSLQGSRLGRLVELTSNGVSGLISADASVSDRVFAVMTSHLAFIHSWGIGYGLDQWSRVAPMISERSEIIREVTGGRIAVGDQIMSGWGAALFQLGFVGVFPIVGLIVITRNAARACSRQSAAVIIASSITLYGVMLMAVPFAFPLFGYTLGALAQFADRGDRHGAVRLGHPRRAVLFEHRGLRR